jgi:type I restriction enzyme S subunit
MKSNWKETNLGEISDSVAYGYTESASRNSVGPKFLRITDIQNDFINWESVPFCPITEKDYLKYKLEIGDVVIARTGNSTGATATIKDPVDAVFASYLIRFRINQRMADFRYVDFLLRSNSWKGYVASVKGGSAQGGANAKSFSSFPIALPPLEEQKKIAGILGSLDDKIELLQKENETLETLAQTLFKRWFVDFEFPADSALRNQAGRPVSSASPAKGGERGSVKGYKSSGGKMIDSKLGPIPEGWRVGKIYDFLRVDYGYPFKSKMFNADKIGLPLIRIRDLYDGDPKVYTDEECSSRYIIMPGDVIAGMDAEFRPCIWKGERALLNQRVCRFEPLDGVGHVFVIEVMRSHLNFYEKTKFGTTVSHLGKGDLDFIENIVPPKNIHQTFSHISEPLFQKIVLNNSQIRTLSRLRDTLLPKLMSGGVRANTK